MVIAGVAPSGTANVGAWRASRFQSSGTGRFPGLGGAIPATPDATQAQAAGSYSLTTPTNEPYWVACSDGNGKILAANLVHYEPPRFIAPTILGGQGNPNTLGVPVYPNGVYYDVSSADPGAGARMFVARGASWVATAA